MGEEMKSDILKLCAKVYCLEYENCVDCAICPFAVAAENCDKEALKIVSKLLQELAD